MPRHCRAYHLCYMQEKVDYQKETSSQFVSSQFESELVDQYWQWGLNIFKRVIHYPSFVVFFVCGDNMG